MKSKLNTCRVILHLFLFFCFTASTLRAQWQAYVPALSDTVGSFDLRIAQGNDQVAWAVAMKYDVTDSTYFWVAMDSLVFTKTTDGGNTWTGGTIPMGPEPYASNICPINADTAWAAGIDLDYVSYIMRTVDGGQTWQRQFENGYTSATSYLNVVHFWDAQNGIAIGDPVESDTDTIPFFEIYKTSDGGEHWTRVNSADIPAALPNEYGYGGDYYVVGDHIWFVTLDFSTFEYSRVFHAADKGATWTAANALCGSINFADSLHGIGYYFSDPDFGFRYTDDGGATWADIPSPGGSISSLVLIPQSHFILTTARDNNLTGPFRTMLSTDLGQTWMEIGNGTELASNAKFSSPAVGYAGEWQPADHPTRMYKYAGSPLVGLFSGQALDARVTTAPNPVSDYLQVQIEVPGPAEFVLLLNDVRGRLISRQHIGKTAHGNARFDMNHLPAGIYTLTMSSEKGSLTRKIVKK